MLVTVIIPVGPGHEEVAKDAMRSVEAAWEHSRGRFTAVHVAPVYDPHGHMGRSRTRNLGLDAHPSDWYFLLDADDEMMLSAFSLVDRSVAATFGAVCVERKIVRNNRWPVSRSDLFVHGAQGTLSMGCFVRGDVTIRFDETLDNGEDFDYYMRLPSFVKRPEPLVNIRRRGRTRQTLVAADWWNACAAAIARYR